MRLRIVLAVVFAAAVPFAASARVALQETGSTLLFSVMNTWVATYGRIAPDVDVSTEATGSGAGISAAENGSAHIGASDAYLQGDAQARGDLLQIPLAISGQFIAYQLPGVGTLRLTAPLLGDIYAGKLTRWNDPRIAALNPGAPLPDARIVPLHRSDRSGDTFLFTSFLGAAAPREWTLVPATAIAWPPIANAQTARGNRELLDLLRNTRYGIAYIGISLLAQAQNEGVGVAALRNRDGAFVEPGIEGLAAATRSLQAEKDARITLIDEPGPKTYPIVNVEYAVVRKKQSDAATAQALRAFLDWIVDPSGGNAHDLLDPVHFVALPDEVRALSRAEIAALR